MKLIKSVLVIFTFLSIFSFSVLANPHNSEEHTAEVTSKIENYLSTIDYSNNGDSVTVFVNFIISEHGDLYSVDFMVSEKEEIVVLSKELEDEFYRVDSLFNSKFVKKYSVPVTNILI